MWISVQYLADASQKSTWPVVSAAVPAFTDAVSVTAVPTATVVTVPLPAAIVRVVDVAVFIWAYAEDPPTARAEANQGTHNRVRPRRPAAIDEEEQRERRGDKDPNTRVTVGELHSKKMA
jgi:hypothetical protein